MDQDFTEKRKHADSIIKNHAVWSMGAGFIPVPIADLFAVSAVQLDMIRQIARVYDLDFKEAQGKAIITALTGSSLARIGARAIKFVPGVGSVLGGVTLAVLSGASTYAIGEVFKKHFETGGTFLDFDLERLRDLYNEKFEKGKVYAKQWQKDKTVTNEDVKDDAPSTTDKADEPKEEEWLERIEQLFQLKEKGAITEEEYEILKNKWMLSES
jgi:uncharacterized protein (DUF697 family)